MASSDPISIAQLAQETYNLFERRPRLDDPEETFISLREDAPEWVSDLVRKAHGEFLPDDWRYESIRSALGFIADNDPDELDDLGTEWADGNVDVYTGARLAWLALNLQRTAYCDEAASEIGCDNDIVQMIGLGQYAESLEVWHSVVSSLETYLETISND